jgi:hypothetical protein
MVLFAIIGLGPLELMILGGVVAAAVVFAVVWAMQHKKDDE